MQSTEEFWNELPTRNEKGKKLSKSAMTALVIEQRRKRFAMLMATDVELKQLVGSIWPALQPLVEDVNFSDEAVNSFAGVTGGNNAALQENHDSL